MSNAPAPPRARTVLVLVALVGAVLATYARVGGFAFVSYDDPDYVLQNPAVRGGLSWAGVRWAFASAYASNWHPLTWLAHMLDVQLFGLAPAGHHWMNVALHALAAVLCFLALQALSARFWASACVAFLFALHPLRVESVAWVSERKDVLAGCAFFALLYAYARYAQAPSARRYALVVLCLVLGLLAKPMLVSAPLVLLLLDVWPLARFTARTRGALVLEKLPLALLAALSCVLTVWSQRAGGSLYTLEFLPLAERLANAPLAVVRYLAHFLWPADLAYFYPHAGLAGPARGSPWTFAVLGALALVVLLTLGALLAARRRPYLCVGWLWFLIMLVPVIGIVQVGEQALADRYAYLPLVGVQLALVFALAELVERRPRLVRPCMLGAGLVLVACGVASARQANVWRDSETLYRHALAVTDRNYPAWVGLANELAARGAHDEARQAYEAAIQIRPSYAPALYGLGLLEQQQGNVPRALELYRAAIAAMPGLAAAHLNLGALLAKDDAVAAAQAFEDVLALFPDHPDAHYDLALLLLPSRQYDTAREHLLAAVATRPDYAAAWETLGDLEESDGRDAEAIHALTQAVRDPTRAGGARKLAWLLATASDAALRDPARALTLARAAVAATQRADPDALEALAAALAVNGEFARAAEVESEALAHVPPGRQGAARARLARYQAGQAVVHEHAPH